MIDRTALEVALAEAEPQELFAVAGELQGRAFARLTPAPERTTEAPSRFITPADAAKIADVPEKRIYDWARNRSWAHRPTRRCLRIDEESFRRWLAAR